MISELLEIQLLRDREAKTWEALYNATCRRTYRVLHHATGAAPAILEELNQDVWLSAIESIDSFDASRGTAQDWLLGIARFKGLTYLRKKYRNRLTFVGSYHGLPDAESEPCESIEKLERVALLRAAVESMPENWQYVLRQKYEAGMSVKDISELVGASPKAVESTLSRARHRLRELISETLERVSNL